MVAGSSPARAVPEKSYTQKSVRKRIEAFLLDNVGKVVTREMLIEVAKDPVTGRAPENWHQRLSELRTDSGYRILSHRDDPHLSVSEYILATAARFPVTHGRIRPTRRAWLAVLERARDSCEWDEDGLRCGLKAGEADPVGGGTVRLTPDHMNPHSLSAAPDPDDIAAWRALCGRHQVMKKNYWDNSTGKINYLGLIQAASAQDKQQVYELLRTYFAERSNLRFRKVNVPGETKARRPIHSE